MIMLDKKKVKKMLKNKKYIFFLFPCEEQDKGFIFVEEK
jgi:hypothetical protein